MQLTRVMLTAYILWLIKFSTRRLFPRYYRRTQVESVSGAKVKIIFESKHFHIIAATQISPITDDTNFAYHLHRLSFMRCLSIQCTYVSPRANMDFGYYPLSSIRRCYNFHRCYGSLHLFHHGVDATTFIAVAALCISLSTRLLTVPSYISSSRSCLLSCGRSDGQLFNCGACASLRSQNLPSNEVE